MEGIVYIKAQWCDLINVRTPDFQRQDQIAKMWVVSIYLPKDLVL